MVGIWERGKFIIPKSDYKINRTSVLVLAGLESSLVQYDDVYSFYHICKIAGDPVIIVGGGRVGRAVANHFQERDIPYLIIEKAAGKMRMIRISYMGMPPTFILWRKPGLKKRPLP